MNKCCYCQKEVLNTKDGFISKGICFHQSCLDKKFKKVIRMADCGHEVFYEG